MGNVSLINQKRIENLLPQLALHKVLKNWRGNINGSDVYNIYEFWQVQELSKLENILVTDDALEFEEALADKVHQKILLTSQSKITSALIERILERNFASKAIFINAQEQK